MKGMNSAIANTKPGSKKSNSYKGYKLEDSFKTIMQQRLLKLGKKTHESRKVFNGPLLCL